MTPKRTQRALAHHDGTGGEGQQPADQSLQLLDEGRGGLHQDGLQAGQGGQLDGVVRTQQGLQQKRQQLDRHVKTIYINVFRGAI